MIPVAPVALPMPENVSVVGESLIPLVDSNGIPTAGTLNLSDSVQCDVMPLVYEAVKQYATGIITEFVLRIPLNSKVGSSLKSDGTHRDESPTSTTGTGTPITSRKLVTMLIDESATVDILRRTSAGHVVNKRHPEADRSKMAGPNPKMIH